MPAQILNPDQVMTPAIDALLRARPRALSHIETGVYGDVLGGWKSQVRVLRARLASEARARRLPFSERDELRDLGRSEYWIDLDETPRKAIGFVIVQRTKTTSEANTSGTFAPGVIKAGHRFRKPGDPNSTPAVAESAYVSTLSVVLTDIDDSVQQLGPEEYLHAQSAFIPVVATVEGPDANVALFRNEPLPKFEPSDAFFDPLLQVTSSGAAGGQNGFADATVRRMSSANYYGQFGPTIGALVARALGRNGVEHVAIAEDKVTAISTVFAADTSWGYSNTFVAACEQDLKDFAGGFGTRLVAKGIRNRRIRATVRVRLGDPRFLSDTDPTTIAIQKALRSYFDDRPDFFTWRTNLIGAAVSLADSRIVECDSIEVLDADGVVSEPPAKLDPAEDFATHWYLADNAVRITYLPPS